MKKIVCLFALLTISLASLGSWAEDSDKKLESIRQAIKKRGARWQAEKTPLFELPLSEKLKLLGAREDPTARDRLPHFLPPAARKLPGTLDWRNHGGDFVTGVRNQGGCGSCWAFAATAVFESIHLIETNRPDLDLDLSEQDLLSCSGAGSCAGGGPEAALEYTVQTGIVDEACFPYSAEDRPCNDKCSDWQSRALRTHRVLYVNSDDLETIKAALQEGPLTMCFPVYEDFFAYSGGVYEHVWGEVVSGHAVAVVGYNDEDQAWIAKNSWGELWGEQGFFRYRYGQPFGCSTTLQKNRPPRFDPLYTQTAREGQQLEFSIRAVDPDGDRVRYSMIAPPELAGASLDEITGRFVWTVPAGALGIYTVRFRATDDWNPPDYSEEEIPISVCTSDCDDQNPCTDDVCPAGLCEHQNNNRFCSDDGNFCTDDQCREGSCYQPLPDYSPCPDDGSECSEDYCLLGSCLHPALPDGTVCSDDGSFCTEDFCQSGQCAHPSLPDGTACFDGARCTVSDMCIAGQCVGKLPPECIDGIECTLDNCADEAWVFRDQAKPFADISAQGQEIPIEGDDAVSEPIEIGFEFHSYSSSQPKSQFWISSNGLITFSGPSLAFYAECYPSPDEPNDFLAPYLSDLECHRLEGCRVYLMRSGQAPEREVTIQWTDARYYGVKESRFTFQAVLFESGGFEFRYGRMEPVEKRQVLIGFEEDALTGHFHQCGPEWRKENSALTFIEDGWRCENYPEKGKCLIAGVCYDDNQPNPQNPCQLCLAWNNNTEWSYLDGTPCDDGQECSIEDICTNGICAGTPPESCYDHHKCTMDTCRGHAGDFTCENYLLPDFCLIDDNCLWREETHPDNPCLVCRPEFDQYSWTPDNKVCDDGDPCTFDDRCREGVCQGESYLCPAGPCVEKAACDGLGGCHYLWKAPGSVCSKPSCQDGRLLAEGHCDDSGQCLAGQETPCAPYTCGDEVSCRSDCQNSEHCHSGYWCDTQQGRCLPRQNDGQACLEDDQCLSGHCQNGFCCLSGDCCRTNDDCPDEYQVPPVCDFSPGCQGHRGQKFCNALSSCTTLPVDDDSGCSSSYVFECRNQRVVCNGQSEQQPPACLVSCQADSDCASGEFCRQNVCQQLPPQNRQEEGCSCSTPDSGARPLMPLAMLMLLLRLRRGRNR